MRHRIMSRLQRDRCLFRVAVFMDADPDLGPHIEAHAFDVPAEHCVAVSRRLNHLLWGVDPETDVIAGAFAIDESSSRLAELPTDVDWYEPTGEVVPVTDYAAVGPAMVREGKGPGRSS